MCILRSLYENMPAWSDFHSNRYLCTGEPRCLRWLWIVCKNLSGNGHHNDAGGKGMKKQKNGMIICGLYQQLI